MWRAYSSSCRSCGMSLMATFLRVHVLWLRDHLTSSEKQLCLSVASLHGQFAEWFGRARAQAVKTVALATLDDNFVFNQPSAFSQRTDGPAILQCDVR